jgi:hypothetical protein
MPSPPPRVADDAVEIAHVWGAHELPLAAELMAAGVRLASAASGAGAPPAAYVRPPYVAWADLLRRVFALDVLACPDCGGRLRLLATIEERAVVEQILTHLRLPVDLPRRTGGAPLRPGQSLTARFRACSGG